MDSVAEDDATDSSGSAIDPEAVLTHIRERGETIRTREQERAIRRLREQRELTSREEQVIETLATQLAEQLLAVPESHLKALDSAGAGDAAARNVLDLFGEE